MANLSTYQDLSDDVLRRAGERIDGTSEFEDRIEEYLNRALLRILQEGITFLWTRKIGGVFNTVAKFISGTVSVTKGSDILTFPLPYPTTVLEGFKVRVDSKSPVYRVKTHTSGASIATLDAPYVDANNSAASYVFFQDEYALATDVLFLLTPLRIYEHPYRINVIDENAMEDLYPLALIVEGAPAAAALIGEQRIRLSHYPADLKRVEYDYVQVLADLASAQTLPMPKPDRQTLADGALYYLLLDKEDSKTDAAGLDFERDIGLMKSRRISQMTKSSQGFGQIHPRQDGKGAKFREGPLRTGSGLIIG